MSNGLIFALVCAIAAIVYGVISIQWIVAKPAGNPRMQEIAAAVQAGAKAYLNRQYTTIGIVGIILFIVIGIFLSWTTAGGFALGAILSGLAGYIGMNVQMFGRRRRRAPGSMTRWPSRFAAAPSPACSWWGSDCLASRAFIGF